MIIQPLCVILPQMDGYIKCFDDGGKNMSFVTNDEKIYEKYNEIWKVIRNLLKIDFTVNPVPDDKYLLAKLNIFDRINRTTFNNNLIPIERNHYICIPVIDIDSVLKIKLKERKIVNYIDDEIIDEDNDSHSDYNDTVDSYVKI